jgi:hypothetical protein
MGSTKGWIEHEEVLAITHRVWTSLFLSAGDGDTEGWLHRRREEDPLHAQQALARPAVTAALFVWSLEIPPEPRTPREVQMLLSLALSVARHPRLWLSADRAEVAREVEAIRVASSDAWSSDAISARWLELQCLGRDLSNLEKFLSRIGPQKARSLNEQETVEVGELLWQGMLGYCVLKEQVSRPEAKSVEVLVVQAAESHTGTKTLRSDLLNPVRGLARAMEASGEPEALSSFLSVICSSSLDSFEE